MNIDWEKEINDLSLKNELPEDGAGPPALEMFKKSSISLEDIGKVSKVTTEILLFEGDDGRTFTGEAHYITDYGKRPLKIALALLKEMKKKMA